MPNWMHNVLVVQDLMEEPKGILKQFYDENNPQKLDGKEILDFSLGVPPPSEVLENQSDNGYSTQQMMDPNNPLNWQKSNWGTTCKCWNSKIKARDEKRLIYDFVTAWSPPIQWVGKVSIKYPNCLFKLFYINEFGEDEGSMFFKNGIGVVPKE